MQSVSKWSYIDYRIYSHSHSVVLIDQLSGLPFSGGLLIHCHSFLISPSNSINGFEKLILYLISLPGLFRACISLALGSSLF